MTQTQIRWTLLSPSIRRCGADPDQFAAVLEQLASARAIERGTPLRTRLLAVLSMRHLRKPLAEVAASFAVHPTTVRRWQSDIEDLLGAGAFRPADGTLVSTVDELLDHLRAAHPADAAPAALRETAPAPHGSVIDTWSELPAGLFTMPPVPWRDRARRALASIGAGVRRTGRRPWAV